MDDKKLCRTCAHDTKFGLGFCAKCWRAHNPNEKDNYEDMWMPADDDSDWTESGNQDAKADAGKPRITLVPRRIIWDIAAVRQYGVEVKYSETGVDGWRTIGKERIRDAMCRHMLRYLDNPDGVDKESGLPHLWHLATNCAFLCEMEDNDDD